MNRTPEDIENERVEKLKLLQAAEKALSTVEEEYHRTGLEILLLEVKKKDLKIEMDKRRHNLNLVKNEAKILEIQFFQNRR